MARPGTSLEALREQHDRATAAGNQTSAAPLRMKARRLAEKLGMPVPTWAAPKRAPVSERKPPKVKPLGVHCAWRDSSVTEARPALAASIPEALSAWRARNSRDGAILQITGSRVVLHTLAERREFTSLAEAVAFAVAV